MRRCLMPTDDRDIQALTYLVARLRAETYGAGDWDQAGIHAILARFKGQNLATTIERAVCHAIDTNARTPAAMERPFLPPSPQPERRQPVKAGEDCRLHVGEHAHACRLCAVEGYRDERDPVAGDGSEGQALIEEIRRRRELAEEGRRLASRRDDLIDADGANPGDLLEPIHPEEAS